MNGLHVGLGRMADFGGPNPVPSQFREGHIGTQSEQVESMVSLGKSKFTRDPILDSVFSRVLQYYQDPNFGLLLSGYGSSMGLFLGIT